MHLLLDSSPSNYKVLVVYIYFLLVQHMDWLKIWIKHKC